MRATASPADPVFRGRARAYAVAVGERILDVGTKESPTTFGSQQFPNLASRGLEGPAGFAIFYGALGELTGEKRFTSAMHENLRRAAHADDRPSTGLFSGISGLRAAAALATRTEYRYSKLVAQCDEFVDSQLPQRPSKPDTFAGYDLIEGWSGVRLSRGVVGPQEPDRLVEFIVWALADPERWRCTHPLTPEEPAQNDLGLAHGLAGMLAALSLTLKAMDDSTAAVATTALRALCELRVDLASHIVWPPEASLGQPELCRSAWCYGAAGVIATVHSAAIALADRETMAFAEDAMRRLAAQTIDSWLLDGEALCHGLMGNAVCFASVAAAADSAELWTVALDVASAAMSSLDARGGKCWARVLSGEYDAVGLLNGVSGIALALLTLSGDADSNWMRLFGLRPIS
jgi:lantibiotic biosynthesis protein